MNASLTSAIPRRLRSRNSIGISSRPCLLLRHHETRLTPGQASTWGTRSIAILIRPHIGQLKVQCWRYAIIHDISFVE